MRTSRLVFLALPLLAACGSPADDGGTDGGATDGGGSGLLCDSPAVLDCEDTMFLQLDLQDTVAPGGITTFSDEAGDYLSHVDATAGGFMADPPHAYVYGKFTDEGLVKVDLSDEDALLSMDWDIALRRYVFRINSGDSGPSCVSAAMMPVGITYEDVTSVPAQVTWLTDDFYDESCGFRDDGSGLPTSPDSALSGYYNYLSCVQMSGNIFLLQLRNGDIVKLRVDAYYDPAKQSDCDATGATPTPPTGSGNIRLTWRYLE